MKSVTSIRRMTTCVFNTTLVVLLFSVAGFAQANFGRIFGSVKDPTGAVLPGAGVSLIDTQRGLARTVTTDEAGLYNAPTLIPGTYTVRVVASDQPSNPPDLALRGEMESRPFTIDNTPPVVTVSLERTENRRIRIAIEAVDQTSTLSQAEIAIDTGDWRPVFPKDGIIDEKTESFSYLSGELSPGEHVIAFRVYDQNDNAGMAKLVVRIP